MEKDNSANTSETVKTRDLNKYANEMSKFVEELKISVKNLTDNEIGMMVEENKVCKAMFQRVFNVLVTEQTRRLNQAEEIGDGISKCMV